MIDEWAGPGSAIACCITSPSNFRNAHPLGMKSAVIA